MADRTITHRVTTSAVIPADASRVYAILADYRNGHPRILPKAYFSNLEVEAGGTGAGTVIRFQMHILGKTNHLLGTVAEPEPGRVLTETYEDGTVTSFAVDPLPDNKSCELTITTDLKLHGGFRGALECRFTTWILRRIYFKELDLIAALVGVE